MIEIRDEQEVLVGRYLTFAAIQDALVEKMRTGIKLSELTATYFQPCTVPLTVWLEESGVEAIRRKALTPRWVMTYFRQYQDWYVDASNTINTTKLEEDIAAHFEIDYEDGEGTKTEEYEEVEAVVDRAYNLLMATGEFN